MYTSLDLTSTPHPKKKKKWLREQGSLHRKAPELRAAPLPGSWFELFCVAEAGRDRAQ